MCLNVHQSHDLCYFYYGIALSVCPYVRSVAHNPCGQDIARTIWSRLLKLSMYTSYGKRKKPIYFQGQISRSPL